MPGTTTCEFTASSSICVSTQGDVLITNDITLELGLSIIISILVMFFFVYVFSVNR